MLLVESFISLSKCLKQCILRIVFLFLIGVLCYFIPVFSLLYPIAVTIYTSSCNGVIFLVFRKFTDAWCMCLLIFVLFFLSCVQL